MQKDLKQGLVSELKPIREGMKNLPKVITFPQLPSIWKHILKPIWNEKDLYTGSGLTPSVSLIILPSHPVALVERLDILMTSKAAGHTGVRNELVSLCDELL